MTRKRIGLPAGIPFVCLTLAAIASAGISLLPSEDWLARALFNDDSLTEPPPLRYIPTDRGTPIAIESMHIQRDAATLELCEQHLLKNSGLSPYVVRIHPPTVACNCHGWVFVGDGWVSGLQISKILRDHGYTQVDTPAPGNLVLYRIDGEIAHSGIVRQVDGSAIIVESKWENLSVFLHPVDRTNYGNDISYYRSPRQGHRLEMPLSDVPEPPVRDRRPADSVRQAFAR